MLLVSLIIFKMIGLTLKNILCFSIIFILIFLHQSIIFGDLSSNVRYYEKLSSRSVKISSRRKRSTDGKLIFFKQASFSAFGRGFSLILYPGSPVLSKHFKAKSIREDGQTEEFYVNPNNFFTGHIEGNDLITVDAHIEEEIFCCNIYFPNDTYTLEPAWRHQNYSENFTILAYRASDIIWDEILPIDPITGNRTKMADGIKLDPVNSFSNDENVFLDYIKEFHTKLNLSSKRAELFSKKSGDIVRPDSCGILLVAEFSYFRVIGNRQRGITAANMISTIQKVDSFFRKMVWSNNPLLTNLGILLKGIIIHESFTNATCKGKSLCLSHYNEDRPEWNADMKLYSFCGLEDITQHCLAHLFTSFSVPNNVLGLAFTAQNSFSPGGLCSRTAMYSGRTIYPRASFSSTSNMAGQQILSQQHTLVVMHGHNWGADHDPSTYECTPPSERGGLYVMYPISVSGFDRNNRVFSPCSIRSIAKVLRVRMATCFSYKDKMRGLCGNGIVETPEECDVGFLEEGTDDPCCNVKICRLKDGAFCSDVNHPCCKDCSLAATGTECRQKNNFTCTDSSVCNGVDYSSCPVPGSLPNNTPCLDGGSCYDGKCLDFCQLYGKDKNMLLTPCLCSQGQYAMCQRCCQEILSETTFGPCMSTGLPMEPGRYCFIGVCDSNLQCIGIGEFMQYTGSIGFLSSASFDKLINSNMVTAVIFITTLFWIPFSLYIQYLDDQNKKKLLPLYAELHQKSVIANAKLKKMIIAVPEHDEKMYKKIRSRLERFRLRKKMRRKQTRALVPEIQVTPVNELGPIAETEENVNSVTEPANQESDVDITKTNNPEIIVTHYPVY